MLSFYFGEHVISPSFVKSMLIMIIFALTLAEL